MNLRELLPNRRVFGLWVGISTYLLTVAFVEVFPTYVPIQGAGLGVPILLTVVFAAGYVALAREAVHPLVFVVTVPLFAIAAFDIPKACPAVACRTSPDYTYWQQLKFFLKWSTLGPTLGVSSEPYQCAAACPYEIDILPVGFGYIATWYGLEGS